MTQTSHKYILSFSTSVLVRYVITQLFVSKSGLVEENAIEAFHHYGVHLSSVDVKLQVL